MTSLSRLVPSVGAARFRNAGRQAILAYEADRADAYRNLIESIEGLHVEGGRTVRDLARRWIRTARLAW